jgi:S1-C subfamily serine protease
MKHAKTKLAEKFGALFLALSVSFSPATSLAATSSSGGAAAGADTAQNSLLIAKPAVVQVTNIVTGELIIQAPAAMELNTPALAGKSYPFTLGATGSGFFVSPDGYLVTNGHVANPDDQLTAYYAVSQMAPVIFKDAVTTVAAGTLGYTPPADIVEQAYQQTLQSTYGGDVQKLADELYQDFRSGKLKIDNIKKSNFIQLGYAAGSQKKVEQVGKPARLIDSPYKGEFDSNDLAILKIEGSNFPTVPLGDGQNIQIGKEIYAIGYPGIVQELMGQLTDEGSQLEPSMTKGVISAKKKLTDGTEAFQTDAAITHGNSGGPAVDTGGKVVGVTTWSLGDNPGGEGFNFLVSVEEVKRLLTRNNVKTDATSLSTAAWAKGLDLFGQKKYSDALKEFEKAKNLYPDNLDLQSYITKCQEAIARGEDKSGSGSWGWVILAAFLVGGLILVGIIVLVIVLVAKNSGGKSGQGTEKSSEKK